MQSLQFNAWANKRLISTLLAQPEEVLRMPMASSFPTIFETALHLFSAEQIWLQRLQLVEHPVWLQASFDGDFRQLCEGWQQSSDSLAQFAARQFNDASLAHVVQYYNLQKQSFKSRVGDVLQHIVLHGAQHRGQIVTMLRMAGVTKIAALDMIVFLREKK